MKLLVINGPNLNMLGIREPKIYGTKTLDELDKFCYSVGKKVGTKVDSIQSNFEGEIVEEIQNAYGVYDGIVINAGGYTHTSVCILDALKGVNLPTVEVHLSDIDSREEFRKFSYISLYAEKKIVGKGFDGYAEAIEYLTEKYGK